MQGYVQSAEQPVVESSIRQLRTSFELDHALGFKVVCNVGDFGERKWGDSLLFLEEVAAAPLPPAYPTW